MTGNDGNAVIPLNILDRAFREQVKSDNEYIYELLYIEVSSASCCVLVLDL